MILLCLFLACSPFEGAIERNVSVSTELENGTMTGSGVILKTGYVLTNYHVVADGLGTTVNEQNATIVAFDKERDLALLRVKTGNFKLLTFRTPKVGEKVFYVGNPKGHTNLVSQGFVCYMDKNHLITNTLAQPGMSGGGLYDYKGRFVGLNDGMEGQPNIGFTMATHVPVEIVRAFLRENLK